MSKKTGVLRDSEITGGESLRGVDEWASETFDGSRHGGNGVYANYVEPVCHAVEHTRRAVVNGNRDEWNRAKDELRSVGVGGIMAMETSKNNGAPSYQKGTYPTQSDKKESEKQVQHSLEEVLHFSELPQAYLHALHESFSGFNVRGEGFIMRPKSLAQVSLFQGKTAAAFLGKFFPDPHAIEAAAKGLGRVTLVGQGILAALQLHEGNYVGAAKTFSEIVLMGFVMDSAIVLCAAATTSPFVLAAAAVVSGYIVSKAIEYGIDNIVEYTPAVIKNLSAFASHIMGVLSGESSPEHTPEDVAASNASRIVIDHSGFLESLVQSFTKDVAEFAGLTSALEDSVGVRRTQMQTHLAAYAQKPSVLATMSVLHAPLVTMKAADTTPQQTLDGLRGGLQLRLAQSKEQVASVPVTESVMQRNYQ